MRAISRPVLLGLFISVGLGLFVLAVLTVGSRQKTFSRTAKIRVRFDDAGGLQAGDNVWLSGVKIGTVKRVSLDEENRVEVVLSVGEHELSHIYRDARGKIGSDGFIGNRIVVLYGGTKTAGCVAEMDELPGERTVGTENLLATLQENNRNLLVITGELKEITHKINTGQGTIGLLLNDGRMAGELRRTVEGLETASVRTGKLTAKLEVFAGELNNPGGLAHQVVADTTVFRGLKAAMATLRGAAGEVADAAENIKQASRGLKGTESPAGVLLHDVQVAADLQATAGHLRTSSEKLDEDLEALQHNFLFRGFFRRREKARKDSIEAARKGRPVGYSK